MEFVFDGSDGLLLGALLGSGRGRVVLLLRATIVGVVVVVVVAVVVVVTAIGRGALVSIRVVAAG